MTYFIVECSCLCSAAKLMFSSNSIKETVKEWYKILEDKDLYSNDGWKDQAVISYRDGDFLLNGDATDSKNHTMWTLGTIGGGYSLEYYNSIVELTPNYDSDIEKYWNEERKRRAEMRKILEQPCTGAHGRRIVRRVRRNHSTSVEC